MRTVHAILAALLILTWAIHRPSRANVATADMDERATDAFLTDVFSHGKAHRQQIDLNGPWAFRRDPNGHGKAEGWHEGKGEFQDTIRIPGAPQAQGIGAPHPRQKTYFMEPFWVRRTFRLPVLDTDSRVWLRIGGILPAAEIYLNGTYIGYTRSSRTPQRVDVTHAAKCGTENLLAIKVCNFPKVRLDGIWEMVECAKMWTGIYRPVAVEITNKVSVIDAYVRPLLSTGVVDVSLRLSSPPAGPVTLVLEAKDESRLLGRTSIAPVGSNQELKASVKVADFVPWSPEHPKLYALDVLLQKPDGKEPVDKVTIRFGMREIATKGTKFLLNGRPVFLRVFGDDQLYPDTLCPPADKEWYVSRLKRARQYGMNGAKSCVETLPPEYLEAADEAGIMIFQEMPFGLSDLRANRYTINEEFRSYYLRELDGLVRHSRNHASVTAYSMSSELEFSNQTQDSFNFFSRDLVLRTRRLAPHALVIDCTGYLEAEDTPKGKRHTDFYATVIPTWMKEVLDETPIKTDRRHPTVLHEYNWWSCYPDPTDKAKYADAQIKPFWLDTLLKTATQNGQADLVATYRKNSLWLQALCRKDGIEYARRNPDVEGYILWLLTDFGQYCEGLLDDFWNPKNVSAAEFLKSNGDTIILLAQEGNRCLRAGTSHQIGLAVSHYGEQELRDCTLRWQAVRDSGIRKGELRVSALKQGALTPVGSVELSLPNDKTAYKLVLEVALVQNDRVVNTNEWSFWAFPEVPAAWHGMASLTNCADWLPDGTFVRLGDGRSAPIPEKASLTLADLADAALGDWVERGGKCVLLSKGAAIENTAVYYGTTSFYRNFRTIPWNAGTSGNSGTVIASHPSLAAFPHEGMCDLQFLSTVRGVLPMEFSPLRKHGVLPIIRVIDHYAANRNNAYMLEFKVGKGAVLATTLGILPKLSERIEAEYLLNCLADYARGSTFQPAASVPKSEFVRLFGPRREKT